MAEPLPRTRAARWLAAAVLPGALLGCETGPKSSGAPPATTSAAGAPAASAAAPTGSANAATPAGSATGAASSVNAAPAGADALAGTWEGSYEAKKGSVALPSGVKDKIRAKDDGKVATGPGKVTVVVDADGSVTGKGDGSLGKFTLTGRAEDKTIRATVVPVDPQANAAMTGVLICMLKDGAMKGELRAAGPDASVVREAVVELKRK